MIIDIIVFVAGIILGLVAGIGIYWWPLCQFTNEWKAIFDLICNRYPRGFKLKIKEGTDLVRVGFATYPNLLIQDKEMALWHDEGVGWFHTFDGWKRVRVIQVYDPTENGVPPIYRVCHLNIKK